MNLLVTFSKFFTLLFFRIFYPPKISHMRKIISRLHTFQLCFYSVFCLCCISKTALAQSDEEMKAMMAYATPGEVHKMMAKSAGTWISNATMWMKPGAPPMNSTGEFKSEMILGGRYLQGRYTGNFGGMPFEGISVTGYDNFKKVFVNSWIDNAGTGMTYMTGTWDPATKSINYTGSVVDPASGKEMPIRQVLTFVDDKTQTMQMFATMGGQEFKTMEIKFTLK